VGCFLKKFMALSFIERSFSCLFTLDIFQLRITFALTAGFAAVHRAQGLTQNLLNTKGGPQI
jgi:hypothetical protein